MNIQDPKFNINDLVYHKTPESGKGVIVDIKHSLLTGLFKYIVVFGRGADDEVECYEHELSDNQSF